MKRALGWGALGVFLLLFFLFIPACNIQQASVAGGDNHQRQSCPTDNQTTIGAILARGLFDFVKPYDNEVTSVSTLFIAAFTIVLAAASAFQYGALIRSIREANADGEIRARQTQEAIGESAIAAAAMTRVADSMAKNVEKLTETVEINRGIANAQKLQLRAYVSVKIGPASFQDRANNIHFTGSVKIVNTASTPAQKVMYQVRVGILPNPLPPPRDFEFLLPPKTGQDGLLPPFGDRDISGGGLDFWPDSDVPNIKRGSGLGFFIWGKITYEDAFDGAHETTFCHLLTWLPPQQNGIEPFYGFFIPGRNRMT